MILVFGAPSTLARSTSKGEPMCRQEAEESGQEDPPFFEFGLQQRQHGDQSLVVPAGPGCSDSSGLRVERCMHRAHGLARLMQRVIRCGDSTTRVLWHLHSKGLTLLQIFPPQQRKMRSEPQQPTKPLRQRASVGR